MPVSRHHISFDAFGTRKREPPEKHILQERLVLEITITRQCAPPKINMPLTHRMAFLSRNLRSWAPKRCWHLKVFYGDSRCNLGFMRRKLRRILI